MKTFSILLTLSLAFLAPALGAQEMSNFVYTEKFADREVSVEFSQYSTILRVMENGMVTDLREVPLVDLPCGTDEGPPQFLRRAVEDSVVVKGRSIVNESVADLLVLYSARTLADFGGVKWKLEVWIKALVAKANADVFPGSGLDKTKWNLVAIALAAGFDEANPQKNGFGFVTTAYKDRLRASGADFGVVLTADLGGYCGFATQYGVADGNAWHLVLWTCGLRTFIHEAAGHGYGCEHSDGWNSCAVRDSMTTDPVIAGCEPGYLSYISNREFRYTLDSEKFVWVPGTSGYVLGGVGKNCAKKVDDNAGSIANRRAHKN